MRVCSTHCTIDNGLASLFSCSRCEQLHRFQQIQPACLTVHQFRFAEAWIDDVDDDGRLPSDCRCTAWLISHLASSLSASMASSQCRSSNFASASISVPTTTR